MFALYGTGYQKGNDSVIDSYKRRNKFLSVHLHQQLSGVCAQANL